MLLRYNVRIVRRKDMRTKVRIKHISGTELAAQFPLQCQTKAAISKPGMERVELRRPQCHGNNEMDATDYRQGE